MLGDSIFVQKLIEHCEKGRPTQASLAACCKEIAQNYKFDCVFIAHASSPEVPLEALAFDGKEDVMDACLYRLGVEERVTLSKILLKNYLDITGKPVFNRAGSLRIQKPSSGIFLAMYRAKQDFLLLGCAHQDSRPYEQELLTEITNTWKAWQEDLFTAVQTILKSGKVEPAQISVSAAPEPPKLTIPGTKAETKLEFPFLGELEVSKPAAKAAAENDGKHLRPVVLVDEVTRLFNKDYFEECLAIEVERAKRYSRHVSLLFLRVTPVDQGLTKESENTIANQIADILFKSLRRVDIICRLDKHKYGIILPDTDNKTYGIIAKRVFKFFKQVMGETQPVFLNISASTYPKHAGNHILLLENTEKLLVQAQEVGPNKAVLPE